MDPASNTALANRVSELEQSNTALANRVSELEQHLRTRDEHFIEFTDMMVNRLSDLEQQVHTLKRERNEQDLARLHEDPSAKDFVRILDGTVVKLGIETTCLEGGELSGDIDIWVSDHNFDTGPFATDAFIGLLPSWKPVIDSIASSGKDEYDVTIDDLTDEGKKLLDLHGSPLPMEQLVDKLVCTHFKENYDNGVFKKGGRLKTMEDIFVMTKEYIQIINDGNTKISGKPTFIRAAVYRA